VTGSILPEAARVDRSRTRPPQQSAAHIVLQGPLDSQRITGSSAKTGNWPSSVWHRLSLSRDGMRLHVREISLEEVYLPLTTQCEQII